MGEDDAHCRSKDGDCEKAPVEPGNVQTTVTGRCGGGSSRKKQLTLEQVSRHFSLPRNQAARELNVCVTVLKTQCRKLGITRWPYRKVKSLQTLIDNVQELMKETEVEVEDGHLTRSVVESLKQTKKLIEEKPEVTLDERTKELRQACFKFGSCKRRLLIGHVTSAATTKRKKHGKMATEARSATGDLKSTRTAQDIPCATRPKRIRKPNFRLQGPEWI